VADPFDAVDEELAREIDDRGREEEQQQGDEHDDAAGRADPNGTTTRLARQGERIAAKGLAGLLRADDPCVRAVSAMGYETTKCVDADSLEPASVRRRIRG